MKLIYCQRCGDIVAPHPDGKPVVRMCLCGIHTVWWEHPSRGILRVHDKLRQHVGGRCASWDPTVWVIGLTNAMLAARERGLDSAADYLALADAHDSYYLFKRYRSLVIRIRPGDTGDTAYADELPEGAVVHKT